MQAKKRLQLINKYFTYTNRERNGILVLVILLTFLQIAIFILHFLPDPHPLVMDKETEQMIALLSQKIKNENNSTKKNYPTKTFASAEKKNEKIIPEIKENFNPNELSIDDWKQKGLSEKQAASIIHWKEKGGTFHSLDDVKKMFVISETNFKRMEPFIRIPEEKNVTTKFTASHESNYKSFPKYTKPNTIIEINQADSIQLMQLPMIGEGRARSIIKYRTMLGGFINSEQLKEVRNLPDSIIQLILPRITLNTSAIKKININSGSADSLYHPYMPKTAARLIVQYRKEHGDYHQIGDLLKLPLFNDEILRKLAPYLTTVK